MQAPRVYSNKTRIKTTFTLSLWAGLYAPRVYSNKTRIKTYMVTQEHVAKVASESIFQQNKD